MRAILTGFGARVAITAPDPLVVSEIVDQLRAERPLHPASELGAAIEFELKPTEAKGWSVLLDGLELADYADPGATVLAGLDHAIACRAQNFLFVHSGCVAVDDRAILLPGRSHAGKSTLVAELVRRGADYLSDEYAVIDLEGRIHPYPKALSLRGDDGIGHPTPVSSIGGRQRHEPVDRAVVVAATYERDARWDPAPLSRANSVLALLDNGVNVRRDPEAALEATSRLRLEAGWVGRRGEARGFAEVLLGLV